MNQNFEIGEKSYNPSESMMAAIENSLTVDEQRNLKINLPQISKTGENQQATKELQRASRKSMTKETPCHTKDAKMGLVSIAPSSEYKKQDIIADQSNTEPKRNNLNSRPILEPLQIAG